MSDAYNPHKSGQNFTIAVTNDGIEAAAPMKMWLRRHMKERGIDIDVDKKNSRTVARFLEQQHHWTNQQTATEYRLYPPDLTPTGPLDDAGDEPADDPSEPDFRLEAELRDFLAHNLATLKIAGLPSLTLVGVEVSAGGGFIDILATDSDGTFYVFELKRGKTPDAVIGQIVRYMAWVTKNRANGKPVRGIIVAKEVTDQLRDALIIVPGISLFEYKMSFTLNPVA